MYIAIVTGAIGSGKTEATRYLAELGARTVSLDDISHDLLEDDEGMRAELVDTFGSGICDDEGTIIPRALAQAAFADGSSVERLDAITHPRIAERVIRIVNQAESPCIPSSGDPAVLIIEVPLPDRAGDLLELADEIVVISARNEIRIDRLIERGLGWEDISNRMSSQLSQEEYLRLGDTIIPNDGDMSDLHARLDAWWAVHILEGWRRRNG